MIALETRNLSIGYRTGGRVTRRVSEGLDLALPAGMLACVLGPNGAGKTTLLRTIAGMLPPLSGTVLVDGEPTDQMSPSRLARRLSVVLTERGSVGLLSAYELVALGRHPYTGWTGRLRAADHAVVRRALSNVGAWPLAQRKVAELSDGERQKVMIARALAQEPQVMILDEPTAYLDLPRRVESMRILRRLAHDEGRAVLLSTHDLDLALRTADVVWLLAGDGSLRVGAPEALVLSGAFEATFAGEGVHFNAQTGSFDIQEPQVGAVDLVGNGLPALWTARALQRQGFAVGHGANGSPWRVQVNGSARPSWALWESGVVEQHESLESLLTALRQRVEAADGN